MSVNYEDDDDNTESRRRIRQDGSDSVKRILEDNIERRSRDGSIDDRRNYDNGNSILGNNNIGNNNNGGGNNSNGTTATSNFHIITNRRVTDLEFLVASIIASMPNEKIVDHGYYHKKQTEENANKAKLEESARKIRNELLVDLIKFSIKAAAGVILTIFVLGLSTKFDSMVNKAVDTRPAQVGVEK